MDARGLAHPCRLFLVDSGDESEGALLRLAARLGEVAVDAVVSAEGGPSAGVAKRLGDALGVAAERLPPLNDLRTLARARQEETVVLVAPGDMLRPLLARLTRSDRAAADRFALRPMSLTFAEVGADGYGVLHLLNADRPLPPPGRGGCRVVLVRHGQSMVVEEGGPVYSYYPVPLTGLGRRQAADLAEALADLELDAIYTSDLARAVETAEILAAPHGLPLTLDRDLREVHLGAFEGMTLNQVHAEQPDFAPWLEVAFNDLFASEEYHHRADLAFPEGESVLGAHTRISDAFGRIVTRHQGETVMVVAHAWGFQALLCHVVEADPRAYFRFQIRYATANVVEVDWDGRGVLHAINAGVDLSSVARGRLTKTAGGSP